MNYFKITENFNLGVIGHYPQISLRKGYNPRLSNSHWHVKGNEFPDFLPNLELELHEKAIPTNILENTGISFGLVIDFSFKKILEKFKLPPHHFYPIKVYYKEKLLDYYWFHCIVNDFWKYLDTQKSVGRIHRTGDVEKIKQKIQFESKDQVRTLRKELGFEYKLKADILAFKESFPKYDFYQIKDFDNENLISENLKYSLDKAKMTGFETKMYPIININSNRI